MPDENDLFYWEYEDVNKFMAVIYYQRGLS
jgi:hypothetical protein